MDRKITEELLERYRKYLYSEEKSRSTIKKYIADLRKLFIFMAGRELTKTLIVEYKEFLYNKRKYKTRSINSFLAAANSFFMYMEWYDLKVKTYKVQKEVFMSEDRELTKDEYKELVQAANNRGKSRISMLIQTICATGIRVSELSAITVHSVENGMAVIYNKGKERVILIPKDLQMKLLCYIRKQGIKNGYVFRTSRGKALDRTYIWREMKKLCRETGVDENKVFPHNLRHLFARTFYKIYKDISKLADILGHNSVETTRIYLKESCKEYRKQLEHMDLLIGL